MNTPYSFVQTALSKRGINTYFQNEHHLVVSRQRGPAWPNAGNSFWISFQQDHWILCTWSPICYRVPSSSDIVELCSDFVDFGSSVQFVVPKDLILKFALIMLSDKEASKVFGWDDEQKE